MTDAITPKRRSSKATAGQVSAASDTATPALVVTPPAAEVPVRSAKRKATAKAIQELEALPTSITKPASPKRKSAKSGLSEKPVARPMANSSEDEHARNIAMRAYLKAEARGFAPGNDLADWLEAETEYFAELPGFRRT